MRTELTKDADRMMCEIYAAYMKRRANGTSKRAAKDFADQATWPEEYATNWRSEDGSETLAELKRAGLIKLYLYGGFCLEDQAIIYMENRFKNGVSEVLDWLGKITSAIPFA